MSQHASIEARMALFPWSGTNFINFLSERDSEKKGGIINRGGGTVGGWASVAVGSHQEGRSEHIGLGGR